MIMKDLVPLAVPDPSWSWKPVRIGAFTMIVKDL